MQKIKKESYDLLISGSITVESLLWGFPRFKLLFPEKNFFYENVILKIALSLLDGVSKQKEQKVTVTSC